jgi:hypothetical protein
LTRISRIETLAVQADGCAATVDETGRGTAMLHCGSTSPCDAAVLHLMIFHCTGLAN